MSTTNGHRRSKLKVAGLHLWNVSFEYKAWIHTERKTLTITTRNRSLPQAIKKVESYLRRVYYPSARISSIEHAGMIDA